MDQTIEYKRLPPLPLAQWIKANWYAVVVAIILLLALLTRFYNLGGRVMAHDEINHVIPSYEFYTGERLYVHSPVTHGPMQFHLMALSYFLFGDNDFTSRLPHALFSIATIVAVIFLLRRYMGKIGALIAGVLFLISPSLMYYGRYARNEAFVALFTVLAFYAVFRYLDRGDKPALYLLTAVTALHLCTKETAYIYAAQMLLFLAIYFMGELLGKRWPSDTGRGVFAGMAFGAIGFLLGAVVFAAIDIKRSKAIVDATKAAGEQAAQAAGHLGLEIVLVLLAVIFAAAAVYLLLRAFSLGELRRSRPFDLLILLGTLILPQLVAFPVKMLGWDPLNYESVGLLRTGIVLAVLFALSVAIGLWWKKGVWLFNAVIFYSIYIVLYTAFFTNGLGFFTGIVGSLGYWLVQQGEERGTQPWYYFGLILVPVYEYLAAFGTVLAAGLGIRYGLLTSLPESETEVPSGSVDARISETESWDEGEEDPFEEEIPEAREPRRIPVVLLFLYWALTALVAYSMAGEKMPWLTVHIAVPLLLSAGWAFGQLVQRLNWKLIGSRSGLIGLLVLPVLFASLFAVLSGLLGLTPPFQGNTLEQLRATTGFIISAVFLGFTVAGLYYLLKDWPLKQWFGYALFIFTIGLTLLNARTAYMANFINQDTGKEYLVYAHAPQGGKEIYKQIEEISRRTTGGYDIEIGYDNDGNYPFWWYLRHYPNRKWYADNPTRELRNYPLLVVSAANYGKIEPIVRDRYINYEYMRLWWPNQDYWNLDWKRLQNAITSPEQRAAIFDIWLNRDYRAYAKINNKSDMTLENWQPSTRFRLYIRKDIISSIWNYGVVPIPPEPDPYDQNHLTLSANQMIGFKGNADGQFNEPKGVAVAPDGHIYVADMRNSRIQRFAVDGSFELAWGSFGDIATSTGNPGTFKEPWGIAVGPDGSVYVADTWNHRVQKFTADGEFIKMWGYFGQDGNPTAFYGPRAVAVDSQNRVYVSDTGNKRVVVFNAEGEYLMQVGTPGMQPGQFDEQVGIAIGKDDMLYVADTWNQRIQSFKVSQNGLTLEPVKEWEVAGWFGNSVDNKPFMAADRAGNVFVTDPEGNRVIQFGSDGTYIRNWGDAGTNEMGFNLPMGIAADANGGIWVVDSNNSRLLHFVLPQ